MLHSLAGESLLNSERRLIFRGSHRIKCRAMYLKWACLARKFKPIPIGLLKSLDRETFNSTT